MYCKGIVVFKGIEKREGGEFSGQNGQAIKYESAYVVKFDEIKEGKVNERKLKFPTNNKKLYDKFAEIEMYTRVQIECEVVLGQSACRLTPIDVKVITEDGEIIEDNEENDEE